MNGKRWKRSATTVYNIGYHLMRKGLGLSPDQAVGLDRSELKPLEREAAVRVLGSNPYIRISFPR